MTYAIFFNPTAGEGQAEKDAQLMADKLQAKGISAEFLTAPDPAAAVTKIKESLEQYEALIAIGGDGTLNLVATAFVQADKVIPFGVIPSGTVNNFAKRWGIPLTKSEAMEVILGGKLKRVGIGTCLNRQKAIVSSFAFGTFADISNEVRQSEKRKWGLIVYPLKALKQLGKKRSYEVSIESETYHKELNVWFALVTTTDSIGGKKYVHSSPHVFHISILHDMQFRKIFQLLYLIFTGRLRHANSLTYFETTQLSLQPLNQEAEIISRIDGDEGPALPLTLELFSEFLPVFVSQD